MESAMDRLSDGSLLILYFIVGGIGMLLMLAGHYHVFGVGMETSIIGLALFVISCLILIWPLVRDR
jgi:hypothetical protein